MKTIQKNCKIENKKTKIKKKEAIRKAF